MANAPAKTQEERAAEKKAKAIERLIRVAREMHDNRIVYAQLEKQFDECLTALQ